MKLSYAWHNDSLFPGVDANEVGNRLSELEAEHGSLTKDIILAEAKRRESPLHKLIERDPGRALTLLQNRQAKDIVSGLRTVKNGKVTKQRAFVYVEPSPGQRKAWVSLVVAVRTPSLRAQVVERAVGEFEKWYDRYSGLPAFKGVKKDMARLRDKIEAELMTAVD